MKLQTVTWARLVNLGNYENERIEASGVVEEGETGTEARQKIQAYVEEQVALCKAEREEARKRAAEERRRQLDEALGITPPVAYSSREIKDDIPF